MQKKQKIRNRNWKYWSEPDFPDLTNLQEDMHKFCIMLIGYNNKLELKYHYTIMQKRITIDPDNLLQFVR